ncbi:MAG: glycosyltransferase [Syntrophaceae bacterium]|nr:glycosyltransferase [Syntrophaceae bacterium]
MKPLVSIIIPVYNGEKYIEEAIKSALNQTYSSIEIIVVDDGSTDKGAELVKKYPVILIQQKNRGISGARNTGINSSRGDFIALLDQDDLFKPHKIETEVEFLKNHSEYCMVYTPEERFGPGEPVRRISKHHIGRRSEGDLFVDLYKRNYITPSSTLIRRNILDVTGLFDESFVVCEEHDLFVRIAYNGMIGFIDQPLIEYRWHGENTSSKLSRLMSFNELRIYKKYLFLLRKRTILWPVIYISQSAKAQMNMGVTSINEKKYVEGIKYLVFSFLKRPWRIKTFRNLIKATWFLLKDYLYGTFKCR